MMVRRRPASQDGFTLIEFAVSALVVAVLAGLLLLRVQQYHGEVEQQSVRRTVNVLRLALRLRLAEAGERPSRALLTRIAEENPFDWLAQKPENYSGEYYSPDLEKMPAGNWVFDRRDKTLIYLLNSHKSFSFTASNFLKFKVEFAQPRSPGVKHGPAEVPVGLLIAEVSDQPAGNDD